ncbi:MAG: ABC transporter permease [Thermomicrobiaceae bacterium]
MTRATALSLISSNLRITLAAAMIMLRDRWFMMARGGYIVLWTARPVFDLAIAALIHASGRTELVSYAVVGITTNAFIFATIFWVGEILDRERMRGTLATLFLSPGARLSWLGGFTLAGAAETILSAAVVLFAGIVLFNVVLNVVWVSVIVVSILFLIALAGMGLVFGALGLLARQANALSNLISPFVMLLGGIYFPVSELPFALRIVARLLPFGYATEAIALATLESAPLSEIWHLVGPLFGFALGLPVLGYLALGWVDNLIRRQGTLELY